MGSGVALVARGLLATVPVPHSTSPAACCAAQPEPSSKRQRRSSAAVRGHAQQAAADDGGELQALLEVRCLKALPALQSSALRSHVLLLCSCPAWAAARVEYRIWSPDFAPSVLSIALCPLGPVSAPFATKYRFLHALIVSVQFLAARGLKLGCSKCRGARHGCGQCRSKMQLLMQVGEIGLPLGVRPGAACGCGWSLLRPLCLACLESLGQYYTPSFALPLHLHYDV